MAEENQIQLFEGKQVRYVWDEEKEKYFFSVVDVIQVLTDSPRPRKYWNALKTKLMVEGSEVYGRGRYRAGLSVDTIDPEQESGAIQTMVGFIRAGATEPTARSGAEYRAGHQGLSPFRLLGSMDQPAHQDY